MKFTAKPLLRNDIVPQVQRRRYTMIKQIQISNFKEVQKIVSAASGCLSDIGVHDMRGSIADAKSILGMMNLDFSHPVELVSENERDLNRVYKALKN